MSVTPVAVVLALALLGPLFAAEAQQPGRKVRLGVLAQGRLIPTQDLPLIQPLRALGWIEGQNVVFESRFDEGKRDQLPMLAAELTSRNVDIIVTNGTPAALAAKASTPTIPIVMIFVADPVRSRLVASLARPGGNVTGMAFVGPDVTRKRLELLKEIVPRASNIAVLFDPLNPGQTDQLHNDLDVAATAMGVTLHPVKVDASSPVEAVFAEALRKRADALLVYPLARPTAAYRELANLAIKHRLATATTFRASTEQGMLLSFTGSESEQYQRAAAYIDRILRGAKPADLPVEQPSRFDLVINVNTAKALGLTLPPSLLLRADKLIE